jgi:hypothetical protein
MRAANPDTDQTVAGKAPEGSKKAAVRALISFPPDLYETLEELAKQKKVSLAWVVRGAAEKYVADQSPNTTGRGNAT